MFCGQCGREATLAANYCSHCGAVLSPPPPRPVKKLYRSRTDRRIAGVCAGVAAYLDIDPTLVRLIWVATVLFAGGGVLGYLIAWIVLPEEPVFAPAAVQSTEIAPNSPARA
jgi:phage shock protein C